MTSRQRPEHRREGRTGPIPELHETYKLGVELLMEARLFQETVDRARQMGPGGRAAVGESAHDVASRLVCAAIGNHRLDDPWPWRFPRRLMFERLSELQRHVLVERLDGRLIGNEQVDAAALRFFDAASTLVDEAEWLMSSFESASVDAELCHVDVCQLLNLAVAQRIAAAAGQRFTVRTVEVARMLRDGQSDPSPQEWLDLLTRVAELAPLARDEAPPAATETARALEESPCATDARPPPAPPPPPARPLETAKPKKRRAA